MRPACGKSCPEIFILTAAWWFSPPSIICGVVTVVTKAAAATALLQCQALRVDCDNEFDSVVALGGHSLCRNGARCGGFPFENPFKAHRHQGAQNRPDDVDPRGIEIHRGTRSGASDRTGFIEAPLMGRCPKSGQGSMYAPTASAPLVPMLRRTGAVRCQRIVFTRPAVSTSSINIALAPPIPLPGTVAPSKPTFPNIARRKTAAAIPPIT